MANRTVMAPCEIMIWHVLPSIRKEFVKSLMKNYDLNQKQVAELLEITPAAICQYLSNKRGDFKISDDDILFEIKESTKTLFEYGSESLSSETCKICTILKSRGILLNKSKMRIEIGKIR